MLSRKLPFRLSSTFLLLFTHLSRSKPIHNCITFSTSKFASKLFPTPEENDLYLQLTTTFHEKLAQKHQKTKYLYSAIIGQALRPSSNDHSILLHKLRNASELNTVQALHKEVESLVHPPASVYNALIKAYIVLHQPQKALTVYYHMLPAGTIPTSATFSLLIHAFTKYDLNKSLSLAQEMKDFGLSPRTGFDFSVLIRLYVMGGYENEASMIWDEMVNALKRAKPGKKGWNAGAWAVYVPFLIDKNDMNKIEDVFKALIEERAIEISKGVGDSLLRSCERILDGGGRVREMEGLIIRVLNEKSVPEIPYQLLAKMVKIYMGEDRREHARNFLMKIEDNDGAGKVPRKVWELVKQGTLDSKNNGSEMVEYGILAPGKGWSVSS